MLFHMLYIYRLKPYAVFTFFTLMAYRCTSWNQPYGIETTFHFEYTNQIYISNTHMKISMELQQRKIIFSPPLLANRKRVDTQPVNIWPRISATWVKLFREIREIFASSHPQQASTDPVDPFPQIRPVPQLFRRVA